MSGIAQSKLTSLLAGKKIDVVTTDHVGTVRIHFEDGSVLSIPGGLLILDGEVVGD
jgi:hypothetical protein